MSSRSPNFQHLDLGLDLADLGLDLAENVEVNTGKLILYAPADSVALKKTVQHTKTEGPGYKKRYIGIQKHT